MRDYSQNAYDLAFFVRRILNLVAPKEGPPMEGDEPWSRGCTGSEKFAPHLIYSNNFSSRHRKKVVYLQRWNFSNSISNPRPEIILGLVRR